MHASHGPSRAYRLRYGLRCQLDSRHTVLVAAENDDRGVRCERADGLVEVVLDRVERRNAIDAVVATRLLGVIGDLSTTRGDRAVLLMAEGPDFCVGGDLKSLDLSGDLSREMVRILGPLNLAIAVWWELVLPQVAVVQGSCMGAGLGLVAPCDVVIAGRSAVFSSAYARVGLSNDAGTTASLSARMGPARARRFVVTGEVLTAEAAASLGLVDEVVDDDVLQERGRAVATELAAGPTEAYRAIKENFAALAESGDVLHGELSRQLASLGAGDAGEGVAAFLARRDASFTGRRRSE